METMIIQVNSRQDARKLMQFSSSNGWKARSLKQTLRHFIDKAPKNVPLTDDDIMAEIRDVRAKQKEF
jgi:hypothetical protein